MKLRALHIVRLPGIHPGFELDDIGPGINVVVGPNASGKSSLLRALRAALYRDEGRGHGIVVTARFEDTHGGELEAQRTGDDLQWRRGGARCDPPPLPEHRLLSCYTLHVEDLLAANADTEQAIAGRLARELAGGYDLRALRAQPPFAVSARHGKAEADALNEADRQLQAALREQRQLQEDEARLDELATRQKQAREAIGRQEPQKAALELLRTNRLLRELERRRDTFPAGMDKLHGDEADRLDTLARRLADHERDLREAADALTQAEALLRESNLDAAALTASALQDRRALLRGLLALEPKLEQLRKDLGAAEAERTCAARSLGGDGAPPCVLSPEAIREVEDLLEKRHALLPELEHLESEIARLAQESADGDEDQLRRARDALTRWLSAPAPAAHGASRHLAVILLLGAALAGIGAAAFALHWGLLFLLLPAAGGAWPLLRAPAAASTGRDEARRQYRESGWADPPAWREAEVRACLDDLIRRLGALEQHKQDRQQHRRREAELAHCRERLERLESALSEHARRAGFDARVPGLSLVRWLHLWARHDEAEARRETLRVELEEGTAEYGDIRQALLDFLGAHAQAPGLAVEQVDAAALETQLGRLDSRLRQRDEARQARRDNNERIERCRRQKEGVLGEIAALYQRLGLAPADGAVPDDAREQAMALRPALDERLARLDDWRDLGRELNEAYRDRDRLRTQLAAHGALLAQVEADDEEGLLRDLETLRERADEYEGLTAEIEGIKASLGQAGRGRRLEAARSERQAAEEALRERLDEAMLAAAGRCLLDEVSAEHQRESQPRALRRAHEWFLKFTGYRYELRFAPDEPRFEARDTRGGSVLRLGELSSGTRMQLLLALRIAFALDAEQGCEPLPLLLDEALTTADPERFAAVVDSLRMLAQEQDRQVFYLTAQPEDLRYWREHGAHCIDLGAVRGGQRAIQTAGDLLPPPRAAIPPPDGLAPEDYAIRLGVPFLDPWDEPGGIHLFHLLRDHLPLLHRLLSAQVAHLGQLLPVLASRDAAMLLSADERNLLRARAEATAAWLEGWRQGRGRPVDRAALEDSGAVSASFLEAVTALCDELGGDGRALVQRLEAGEVKRFQTRARENLETWLRERGHIDDREPLAPALLALRVAAALSTSRRDDGAAAVEAQALIRHLEAGMAGGVDLREMEASGTPA